MNYKNKMTAMSPMSRLKIMLSETEELWAEMRKDESQDLFDIELLKIIHIQALIMRGMVGGVMPDSLYRLLCARFMTILHACMDMKVENEGEYLLRAGSLKTFKDYFDFQIKTYLEHQSR